MGLQMTLSLILVHRGQLNTIWATFFGSSRNSLHASPSQILIFEISYLKRHVLLFAHYVSLRAFAYSAVPFSPPCQLVAKSLHLLIICETLRWSTNALNFKAPRVALGSRQCLCDLWATSAEHICWVPLNKKRTNWHYQIFRFDWFQPLLVLLCPLNIFLSYDRFVASLNVSFN